VKRTHKDKKNSEREKGEREEYVKERKKSECDREWEKQYAVDIGEKNT
jgi:hypothetical protein